MKYPPELPITEKREEILRAISENQVIIITGETGSGKSTQIPKMCLEAGRGMRGLIGCTQPRRIAAMSLASRVAEEMGEWGRRLVGYKIRFQDRTARTTRVKFMTDGILLAEAQGDRHFHSYDTLIIDEAHERSLNIDFLLGLIKKILPKRPELKVIITSATIDPEKFSVAFENAPIIEVSGRTYPVEVWYRSAVDLDGDNEEETYVDQAMAAVDDLRSRRDNGGRGDILIFMPTESDIREMVQRLEEKHYVNTLVLPLFGRMAASDQQRAFSLPIEDKIIVATNVAETSITIPRIKYVIDTGMARISQYNPRSRTRSLPVLPVSRASADQRKGRCGRVAAGICIRLYPEEDYIHRPQYTPPEIQRSNLAEVILRMLFLRLGDIQDFPFLDPPSTVAVKDGFAVLKELKAVDDHRGLTPLGRRMARLPLDPRLARMLLEAQKEGSIGEMLILAAALSIQDPKERPLDQEARADQVHATFRDSRSDFVTLLKIWNSCWGKEEGNLGREARGGSGELGRANGSKMCEEPSSDGGCRLVSRSRLRKFCREHFLSYRRMREWRDVYEEIRNILEEPGEQLNMNASPASYEAIHRALVSGYLSHIALRKEKNLYLATRNRQAMLFPGSSLFNKGGSWIVAAEMVQTTRLYARTAANIEVEWLEEFGRHLCRYSYSEPHWEKKRGQVVAYERVVLYGLSLVERRKINYGRIDPKTSREIFIRSALVEGELPGRHGFLDHNRRLVSQIEELESKVRRRDLLVDDETLYEFYEQRVPNLSDIRSFDKFLKDQGGDTCLRMTTADLLRTAPDFEALEQFPDDLSVGDVLLPLRYLFHPGQEDDGVTVTIPSHVLPWLTGDSFAWLVPGMLQEKIFCLVKGLPKSLRRQMVPVSESVKRLVEGLEFGVGDFGVMLSRSIVETTGIKIPVDHWVEAELPSHLKMRFEIVGPKGDLLGVGRDFDALRSLAQERHEDHLWEEARKTWERERIISWDFGDVPQRIEMGQDSLGVSRYAYPALVPEDHGLALRIFEDPQEAMIANRNGLMLLYQLSFAGELKQLKKAWVFPDGMVQMLFFVGPRQEANRHLQFYLLKELFDLREPQWLDHRRFEETVSRVRGRISSLGQEMLHEVFDVLKERDLARSVLDRFRKMAGRNRPTVDGLELVVRELDALVPRDFLLRYDRHHLQQLPRYLKALQIRGERVYVSPEKDCIKSEMVAPHERRYETLKGELSAKPGHEGQRFLDEYRWMIEEFKIGVFAPEIGTRIRVSKKRLDEKWQQWQAFEAKVQ